MFLFLCVCSLFVAIAIEAANKLAGMEGLPHFRHQSGDPNMKKQVGLLFFALTALR